MRPCQFFLRVVIIVEAKMEVRIIIKKMEVRTLYLGLYLVNFAR